MGEAEELNPLRDAYEQALSRYEHACSALHRHVVAGTQPSSADLQREADARLLLDTARRLYLDGWMLP